MYNSLVMFRSYIDFQTMDKVYKHSDSVINNCQNLLDLRNEFV
jgi:hypothetical protein